MYRRIRDLREDHDYKQEKLAELLGCHQSTYSDYETGRSDLSSEKLIVLTEIYGVSADYILGLSDDPSKYEFEERVPISQRMKELRKKSNLTQAQVGAKINCSQRIYSDYESGKYDISTETLIALAQLYHISADHILGISDK